MSGNALSSFTSGAGRALVPGRCPRRVCRLAVMRLWGKRAVSWGVPRSTFGRTRRFRGGREVGGHAVRRHCSPRLISGLNPEKNIVRPATEFKFQKLHTYAHTHTHRPEQNTHANHPTKRQTHRLDVYFIFIFFITYTCVCVCVYVCVCRPISYL